MQLLGIPEFYTSTGIEILSAIYDINDRSLTNTGRLNSECV